MPIFSIWCDWEYNKDSSPLCTDMEPDIPKIRIATTKAQKNCSFPYQNGCISLTLFLLVLKPINNNIWFTVSENEWRVSAHIELLPVKKAANSFETAIARFPNKAAITAFCELPFSPPTNYFL